jgi:hypothetical protein
MRASAVLAFIIALAAAPAAADSLVYRVDSATAVISGKQLIITARGAVKTGGWDHPHLVARKSHEVGDLDFELVATPPENSATVIQALMPVKARVTIRLPKNDVAAVRVTGASNTVTAQIIPKSDAPAPKLRTTPH